MIIRVNDIQQRISLCEMKPAEFLALGEVIKLGRRNKNRHVQRIAKDLHISVRWLLDSRRKRITLRDLTWAEVFMLEAVLVGNLFELHHQSLEIHDLLDALDAAIESSVGSERFGFKDE